jgi:hypothetical protein
VYERDGRRWRILTVRRFEDLVPGRGYWWYNDPPTDTGSWRHPRLADWRGNGPGWYLNCSYPREDWDYYTGPTHRYKLAAFIPIP